MAKTWSMTSNQNHDDNASSRDGLKTRDNDGVATWSELNDDVLYLVMMRLGVVDFVGFSGVCKSWRSFALSKRIIRFMASKPPMSICISNDDDEKECCLEDFEGRKFKTLLPHSRWRTCIGLTCGYLILLGDETHDFWLVNPITRHELHLPDFPVLVGFYQARAILVFSPSIPGWVLVVIFRFKRKIWFCIEGKGEWNHVSSRFRISDLHGFKGKIYTLNDGFHLCEMRLSPKPKLTLLQKKNFGRPNFLDPEFLSSDENLYAIECISKDVYVVQELDFGKLKWVYPENKIIGEHVFFLGILNHGVAIKPKSCG